MQSPKGLSRIAWLAATILVPSCASFSLCLLGGALAAGLHLLAIGIRQNAILPNFLDGQWDEAFGQVVKQPLNHVLEMASFNNILIIIMWGLIGLIIYGLAERAMQNYKEWRSAEKSVQLIAYDQVLKHPLERPLYAILAWRAFIVVLSIVYAIVALMMLRRLIEVDMAPPYYQSAPGLYKWCLFELAAEWALLLHFLVVLLRMAARRTRLYKGAHHFNDGADDAFLRG